MPILVIVMHTHRKLYVHIKLPEAATMITQVLPQAGPAVVEGEVGEKVGLTDTVAPWPAW